MDIDQIKAEVKQYLSCDVCGSTVVVQSWYMPISMVYMFEFSHCNDKTFSLTDMQMFELVSKSTSTFNAGLIILNLKTINEHLLCNYQIQYLDEVWRTAHRTLVELCGALNKTKQKVCSCGAVVTNPNAPLHSSWCDAL